MIRVGTAGWSYGDWHGVVYPGTRPRGFHPLAYLARFVDCVEVNSTFYAQPNPVHAAQWVRLVEGRAGFRFTAKLLRDFTHEPWQGFDPVVTARAYAHGLAPLADAGRLAGILVQFPFAFRCTTEAEERVARIHDLLGRSLPGVRLVVELRHASWFHVESQHARERLAARGFSIAHIDLPAGPEHAPREFPTSNRDLGYLRLHGRNRTSWFDPRAGRDQKYDYLYTVDETREITERVRRLATGKDETFVITNNHFAGQALVNALEILAELRQAPPLAPAQLVERYPRLKGVVRTEGQGSLF